MQRYIAQRILAIIPVLLIVAIIVFSLLHITPGDPVSVMAGDLATPEQIARIKHKMGLDRPLHVQLGKYLGNLARGDLGESIFNRFKVTTLIKRRLEPTFSIGVAAKVLSILIGIPLGILAAWKANSVADRLIMIFAVTGLAIPSFWLGFNLIWLFAVKLGWFPAVGYVSITDDVLTWARHITLPVISIGFITSALITRMTRATMLEVLREDYIRTARAKGLAENVVLIRHALKNAALPIVTIIGLGISALISGSVIIESVFAIPGVGRLLVDAVLRRDYPIIQGIILVVAFSYVLINFLIDLSYGYFDPKIRFR